MERDVTDSGLREVARHAAIISSWFARKKCHFNSKKEKMKEIEYQLYGYRQKSGLGHMGRRTRRS